MRVALSMVRVSLSGSRRWIAPLLLLAMVLTTEAWALGSHCMMASPGAASVGLVQRGDGEAETRVGESRTQPPGQSDSGVPASSGSCASTAIVLISETSLELPPLLGESVLHTLSESTPDPPISPEFRPPRQV